MRTVGILGLGYVGIPLALTIANSGQKVFGFDVLEERVNQLNTGKSPLKHVADSDIEKMISQGFEASLDFAQVAHCDALVICVPTPLNRYREPDLGFVVSTMEEISPFLREGQLLSLESTTWPGTTKEVLAPYVEKAGLQLGQDFFLVYSPEREDPGNKNFSTRSIPKVIGGCTEACLKKGVNFYSSFIETVIEVSSTEAAEMVKLLENIHRAVNIGLVNELKFVTDAMGIDIFEIVDAAASKPFGFTPYYPGPGIGGHCIPIDPFYLTWKAREFGLHTRFIELAGEVNASMPQYVVDKTAAALNQRGKAVKGAKILILGIAYKKDVDDMRESPSVEIMEKLREMGSEIAYSDPNVEVFPIMRNHKFELTSIPLEAGTIEVFDAVLLLTDHTDFDYELIKRHASLLIDTRGKFTGDVERILRA
jgi:UDP-N-acetyl-D-glucosamine dehydrogenase